MSRVKSSKTPTEVVTFTFRNITLNNVPFCHKTLSVKIHVSMNNNFQTEPTPVDNFIVQWTKTIEFTRQMNRDALGHLSPLTADVFVYTHTVKGSGKGEIANGKIDLTHIVRNGMKHIELPLTSIVLESNLCFDVEIKGGASFVEKQQETDISKLPQLPNILISSRRSWFTFRHNQDSVESDACRLADVAMGLSHA